MKSFLVVCGKDQITGEVLVLRVRFDDLIGVDGLENRLAGNRAALETHVHMIGPQDRLLPDAGLDNRQRIIGKLALRRFHTSLSRTCWTEHRTLALTCCRKPQRGTSGGWRQSGAVHCWAASRNEGVLSALGRHLAGEGLGHDLAVPHDERV